MALFKKKTNFSLNIERQLKANGIVITISINGNPTVLPVRLTVSELKKVSNIDLLQLIEDLYIEEKLTLTDIGQYLLPYEVIYGLTPEERELLELPGNSVSVHIELANEGFVGAPTFKFVPKIHSESYVNLHKIGKRKGPFIELPSNEIIFMENSYYNFLEEVENRPSSNEDLFSYVAKIKKLAKELGIPVSEHIERENYEFIDDISIDVKKTESGIEMLPDFETDLLEDEELNKFRNSDSWYTKKNDKRIFIDKEARRKAEQVRKIAPINGSDIPKFIQNPVAFLPEELEISLEDFSDRVKNLGIRVYNAHPFVHANCSDNGWFDYETGYVFRDQEGNEVSWKKESFFGEDEVDFKQLDENTYVRVPEQYKEFKEVSKGIKEDSRKQVLLGGHSHYILEIFQNIVNVEYNQPLREFGEELKSKKVFKPTPPPTFRATLKPFQADGFVWMKALRYKGGGGLLADDMGLGKTIQIIAFLSYLKEMDRLKPTLLVLPKSLIQNWKNEMEKFAPSLTENLYVHSGPSRMKDYEVLSSFDIVLTTYQTLVRDQLIMGRVGWQLVVCDEAQTIKNPTTSASVVVKALKNKARIALTGTPVENNLSELWSIVDFVQPGLLGSLKDFKKQYDIPIDSDVTYEKIRDSIETKLKYIYKRRTKSGELKDQLPAKSDHKLPVAIGNEQEKLYFEIIDQINNKDIKAIEGIMKLKMLCSHPGLIHPSMSKVNYKKVPKLNKTMEILKDIKNKNEKAIIFTEYRRMQAILKKHIVDIFNVNPEIINGETSLRQDIVDEFNRSDGFGVLILSPKAAGTGLTITGANHVIHYTRWWNPAVENQATDRVYRIGQEREVHVYYPIIKSNRGGQTVEEIVDSLITKKKELAENIIVPSKEIDIEKEVLNQLLDKATPK